jgi:chemotaxis protein CheD
MSSTSEAMSEKNDMLTRTDGQRYVYLTTGQLYFTADPTLVETVLGSSLSVVMRSRSRSLSAICRAFLPRCLTRTGCSVECVQAGLIVECSVMVMADWFRRTGIPHEDIEVKVIGGADILEPESKEAGTHQVGLQNVYAAVERIGQENLTAAVMDVGGTEGRRLLFDTGRGEVVVRRLPSFADEVGQGRMWKE